jgi:peptidyl-prolyl cis-trans isomerase B (cyclophilin B)
MKFFSIWIVLLLISNQLSAQREVKVHKRDRRKDIELITDSGRIVMRLSDSTPLHRDNFIKLVKQHYYDGILFHRVISKFMIQAGDPKSKLAKKGEELGNGGLPYTIPAEIVSSLFHRKGVLAAARMGDNVNPNRESSASQFYIVQGKTFTPASLDSVETVRLKGYKIPQANREIYQTIGGAPHLDRSYTIFGEVIQGLEVVDKIAATKTSGKEGGDRPLEDIHIVKMRLIRRNLSYEL